jgi:hypothetical protein
MTGAGFPHSDIPGSTLGCQLPRAYRRLLRPSSALDAKASTMCPSQLVAQTLNKNNKPQRPKKLPAHTTSNHTNPQSQNPQDQCPPAHARYKMLASTIQISKPTPTNTHTHQRRQTQTKEAPRNPRRPPHTQRARAPHGVIPQSPTVCHTPTPTNHRPRRSTPTTNTSRQY